MIDIKAIAHSAPQKYRALYLKALQGKLSPRSAIKIKCLECCAWERFEGGKDKIGSCSVMRCPLWSLRPFQNRAQRPEVSASGAFSLEAEHE